MGKIETCLSKRRYSNSEDAQKVLLELNKKKKSARNVYKCSICGNYHITSMENKTVRRRQIFNNIRKQQKKVYQEI